MKPTTATVAWLTAAIVTVVSVVSAVVGIVGAAPSSELAEEAPWSLVPVVFALSGALIVSSQPRNLTGWLLLAPAAAMAFVWPMELHLATFDTAPQLTPALFVEILIVEFAWVFLIFPLFHLLQVFPTGRVLSPRWRWLTWLEIAMLAVLAVIGIFADRLGTLEGSWTLDNPIGFIGQDFIEGAFSVFWTPGLIVLALGGLASSIVRFRRSGPIERRQLELVLYAIVVFAGVYSVLAALPTNGDGAFPLLIDIAFLGSIVAIPVVIAYAVVRRGLFDIEVIVRRTLVYAALTGLLAVVYSVSVILLRQIIGDAAGARSSLSVAASTLLAAALFSPARRRIQALIDRRLFRSRYDAQQVVEAFSGSLRDVADLTTITRGVYGVMDRTVKPRTAGLWIRDTGRAP